MNYRDDYVNDYDDCGWGLYVDIETEQYDHNYEYIHTHLCKYVSNKRKQQQPIMRIIPDTNNEIKVINKHTEKEKIVTNYHDIFSYFNYIFIMLLFIIFILL